MLLRAAVDLVIDGGSLPGTPSTVVDLRRYEVDGEWSVMRSGAVGERELTEALHWQYHFDASTYADEIRDGPPRLRRTPGFACRRERIGREADSRARHRDGGDGPSACSRAIRTPS